MSSPAHFPVAGHQVTRMHFISFFNHRGLHECSHTCHNCQSSFPGPQITCRPGRVMNNSTSFASQENIASACLWKCCKCTRSKKKLKFLRLFISGAHKVRSASMGRGKPPFTEVHCRCLHGNQQSENIMANFWICLIYAWDGAGTRVRHAEHSAWDYVGTNLLARMEICRVADNTHSSSWLHVFTISLLHFHNAS